MLSPYFLEHFADEYLPLADELDEAITRDIARRIVKTGELTATARHQIDLAQQAGMLYDDIIADVARFTKKSKAKVREMFEAAGITAVEYDMQIYEAAGLMPVALIQSDRAKRVLTAGINKTNGLISNLTKTTANAAQNIFIHAATIAEMQVNSGAFDTVTAIRNAVRAASEDGNYVIYPSGHRDKLDVAMRRAVETGVNQTTMQITLAYAEEMGCDLMEVSAHYGARPSHAEWQGKVYSISGNAKGYDKLADATGFGTGEGLCGWNCRHQAFPFFEGLSKEAYSPEMLKDMSDKTVIYNGKEMSYYDATQKQRAMERAIRSTKREFCAYDAAKTAATDQELKKTLTDEYIKYAKTLKSQEAKYKDFCNQTGFTRETNRLQVVAGESRNGTQVSFGRSEAQKAVHAANAYYKTWIKEIGAESAAPPTLAKYYEMKYNDTWEYTLLKGYSKAVQTGELSSLVSFEYFIKKADEVNKALIGLTVKDSVTIERYSPHFIARVIGHPREESKGKRQGVAISDIIDTLTNYKSKEPIEEILNCSPKRYSYGDIRQKFKGDKCAVTVSLRDGTLIQTNPIHTKEKKEV